MKRYNITTGTITYAIKGKDALRKKGYTARIEKNSSLKNKNGCSYSIILEGGNINTALRILGDMGVKVLAVNEDWKYAVSRILWDGF